MAERSHEVVYRAIANFDDARKKAKEFRDELKSLKAEQEGLNRSTVSSNQQAEQSQSKLTYATNQHTKAVKDDIDAQKNATAEYDKGKNQAGQFSDSIRKMSEELKKSSREAEDSGRAVSRLLPNLKQASEEVTTLGRESEKTATKFRSLKSIGNNFGTEFSSYLKTLSAEMKKAWRDADEGTSAFTKLRRAMSAAGSGGGGGGAGIFSIIAGGADSLGRTITSLLGKLSFWPAIILAAAAAAGPLAAVLGSLGAVALGAGSALISLAGSVAALPGLVLAAAGGIGALVTAISPLAGALKAYQATQDQVATSSGKASNAAEQQAERIKTASRGVEQANRAVGDAERGVEAARRGVKDASRGVEEAHLGVARAARGVADAEYNLTQANRAAKEAQEAVNEARKDAREDLEDLRREVDRSGLNEERAVLNLVRAQEEYSKVLKDPTATLIDRREALLRLREAENDLDDVRRKNKENQEELNEAEKKGVEGSDRVVDAKRAVEEAARRQKEAELAVVDAQRSLVDANRRVADAQQNVADAQQRVIDAQYRLSESHRNVTDAEEDLADAHKTTAQAATAADTAQQKYQAALEKLSPSARKVLLTLIDMKEAWGGVSKSVQEAVFAPVVGQLKNLEGLLPTVENLLVKSGAAIGKVAARGIEMVSSGPWKKDFGDQAKTNAVLIENMGDAGLYLLDALRNITRAADPFTRWLTVALKQGAENFASWSKSARDSGQIERFLEVTKRRLQEVWQVTKNVALTLVSWGKAAEPFTDWMMERLQSITGRWREVAQAQEKATSPLRKYLEDVKPLLTEVGGLFGDLTRGFASAVSDTGNIERAINLIKSLREELGPALSKVLHELGESGIDQDLVDALSEILGAIGKFLEDGGGQALSTFVTVLAGFVEVLANIATLPVVGEILGGVATALAAVAAVAIVSRFTGLFKIVDAFRWFAANRGNLRGAFADAARGMAGLQTGNATTRTSNTVVPTVGASADNLNNQAKAQDRVADSARNAGTRIGVFARAVDGMKTSLSNARNSAGNLASFLGGPWGVALAAASVAIAVLSTASANYNGKIDAMAASLGLISERYKELASAGTTASAGTDQALQGIVKNNPELQKAVIELDKMGVSFEDLASATSNGGSEMDDVLSVLDTQIDELGDKWRKTPLPWGEGDRLSDRMALLRQLRKALTDNADAMQTATTANELMTESSRKSQQQEQAFSEFVGPVSVSMRDKLTAAYQANTDKINALRGYVDVFSGAESTAAEKADALRKVIDAQTASAISSEEATENWNSKLLDLKDSVDQNSTSLDIKTRAGLKNRDAIEAAATAARELFLQDIASKVPMDQATKRHQDRITELKEEARRLGLGKKATQELIDKYGEIPESIKTEIKNDEKGFQTVYKELRRLQYMQDALRRGLTPDQAEDEWKKAEGRRVYDEQRNKGVGRSPSGTVGDGYGAPGFATGGPVYGAGTRTSDSISAWLSNGEFVQPTNTVEHYGLPVMEALRNKSLDKSVIEEALPGKSGSYSSGGHAGHNHFASGGQVTVPMVVNPKKTKVDEGWVYSGLGMGGAAGDLGDGTGGGGYQWQMAALRAVFPGLPLISGFRRGSRTLSGNLSYHARGRAVDLPPRRDVAKWIYENYGKKTKELITPYPEYNLHNGKPHRYTGAIWNQHNFAGGNAHDHWAYRDGGLVSDIPPKMQFGFPSMDTGSMYSAAAMPNASSSQLSQAAQSVINQNRGVHVENLNVNNPVPERASDSLARQVTKLAVLGDI